MATGQGEISRARGALRRVRNGLAEALPALAALEELADLPDSMGRYTVAQDEELDEADVLDFIRLARGDNSSAVTIVVLGRTDEHLSEVTGQQAADPGGNHVGSAGHHGRAVA